MVSADQIRQDSPSVLTKLKSDETGQALAEACIVLSLVVGMFLVVNTGYREQAKWHQDLVTAHTVALSVALGHRDVSTSSMTAPEQGKLRSIWDGVKKIGISLIDPLLNRIGAKIPLPGQKTGVGAAIGRSVLNAGRSMGAELLARKVGELDASRILRPTARLTDELSGRGMESLRWRDHGQKIELHTVDQSLLGENRHQAQIVNGPMQWVRVGSLSSYGNHAWQLRGSGAVAYTHDTIDRIDGSEDLWQSVNRSSRALVKRLAPMTTKVDAPWGRDPPPTDWLSKWSEVSDFEVPEKPTGVMAVVKTVLDVAGDIF